MATLTTKEAVMAELESRLNTSAITVANGYNNDLQFFDRQQIDASGLNYQYPGLFLNEVGVDSTMLLKDLYRQTLRVLVVGWVYSDSDLATALETLEQDVVKAMFADPTLGGKAQLVSPNLGFVRTDEGFRHPLAVFAMEFEITYYTETL